MTASIHDSRKPLDPGRIKRIEEELGCVFPKEYRDFLLAHNGGEAVEGVFLIHDPPNDYHGLLDQFLCISPGDSYDLSDWVSDYIGRLPSNLLPVAVDQAGNLIALSVAGSDIGRVYFWDHELEAGQGKVPSYDNVYPVADSFQAFLDSLRPFADSNIENAT
jgi:hypothetical protein